MCKYKLYLFLKFFNDFLSIYFLAIVSPISDNIFNRGKARLRSNNIVSYQYSYQTCKFEQ